MSEFKFEFFVVAVVVVVVHESFVDIKENSVWNRTE